VVFIFVGIIIIGRPISSAGLKPARNLAPATFIGGEALEQLWVYISGPLIEFSLASKFYTYLKFEEK
jgi:aquaporin Z